VSANQSLGVADAQSDGHIDVAIIGTGFSGLGMAIQLLERGQHDFLIFERADDVGGTWRDNTYPGAACDVQAHLYSFSFAPNPHWKSTFGTQTELLAYLRETATRFGVRPHLRFGHELLDAAWDNDLQRWTIQTSRGTYSARILVSATGYLSEPAIPAIAGLERFEGEIFHSSRWNHEHDLNGRRVAVIGTGASAIQFVPQIQPIVEQLDLYQRSAPWVAPKPDKPNVGVQGWALRNVPGYQRFRRDFNKWGREVLAFAMARPKLMVKMQKMSERHLKDGVADIDLRRRLTPDYVMGCKRLLFSNEYYPAVTSPNVDVVTNEINHVTGAGIVTADGTEREVDTIILGTGFAATKRPIAQLVRGRHGRTLAADWSDGMSAYLGTTVSGFPNLFMLLGPNTGLAHSSMTVMIEAQIEYVLGAISSMAQAGATSLEVRPHVQARYQTELDGLLAGTVWTAGGCTSWYLDDRRRNTTVWPTYTWRFRRRTRDFNSADYFVLQPAVRRAMDIEISGDEVDTELLSDSHRALDSIRTT
jgi:cation diffusion facilitator CzcD-associated flavoprotein CzcO